MKRFRNFMLSQTTDHTDIDKLERQMIATGANYAIILHDKDIGTPHYQIALSFDNARTINSLAKKLNIAPNFIEKWDNRTDNLWSYIVHKTTDAKNTKQDYTDYIENPDKFRTNLPTYKDIVDSASARARYTARGGAALDKTIHQILTGEITRRELLKPENLRYYYDNRRKIDDAIKLRTESLRYNSPDCEVHYIQGESGLGKTKKATQLAELAYGENFTMASSSNDPLQDYTGEKCLIIDDFRPQDYDFINLLAMLDPYYRQRTHQSRYYNKPLATETIIITSIYTVQQVERYYKNLNPNEEMRQLRRRIQTIYQLEKDQPDVILGYNFVDDVYLPITGNTD